MSDDRPWMISVESMFYICLALVIVGLIFCSKSYQWGDHYGTCVEMCRPAKFDDAQNVNGGCLCIGSDKVLRFKEAP